MLQTRVIPVLLMGDAGLVKTVKFKDPKYVGDPINAVKIFNEKEVDEIIVLDILASHERRPPNLEFIAEIASECFMPLCYGGGISNIEEIKAIFKLGVEKVSLNTAALADLDLVRRAADIFGSQAIVVTMDVNRNLFGKYSVTTARGTKSANIDPVEWAQRAEAAGAGEIMINAVHADGTGSGYDLKLIRTVADAVNVPVIACGGAGSLDHFRAAVDAGASAVAAGSFFVFVGKHRAVLITYPGIRDLEALFSS